MATGGSYYDCILLVRDTEMRKLCNGDCGLMKSICPDLTGLFWTKPYERIGLAKELGNAEEAV
jgi:hypothetical protein